MSLLLNRLSRFVIAFLPRSKCLLISWLQSLSTVQIKPVSYYFLPFYLSWSDGTRCHDLHFFECWVLSQLFHSPLSLSSRGSLVPPHFLPLELYHRIICISEVLDISASNLDSTMCFIQPSISHAVTSLVAQRLKHLPAMWESWVRSLGQEDPLEKEMATHSSILA